MTTDNSLDPYDNEGRWIHSEEHRKAEANLAEQRRAAQAVDPIGGTSSSLPAAPINLPAPRKRMALDMKICLWVLVVCIALLALMAHW